MIKIPEIKPPSAEALQRQILSLEQENDDLRSQLYKALKDVPQGLNPSDFVDDDSTFNFRVNSALKNQFAEICKRQHLTVGIALKRYMTDCVVSRVLK